MLLAEHLKSLRAAGKLLFLTSNSNVDYMETIMTLTLGKEWMNYFDTNVVCCMTLK